MHIVLQFCRLLFYICVIVKLSYHFDDSLLKFGLGICQDPFKDKYFSIATEYPPVIVLRLYRDAAWVYPEI